MPIVSKASGQQSLSQTSTPKLTEPKGKQNESRSKLLGQHAPAARQNIVRIDKKEVRPGAGGKVRTGHEKRRYDRIVDTVKMLEKSGALSKEERKWLVDLGHREYESYCKLGDMLIVPKYWRPNQLGVWKKGDRDKIRMQTLKAAVAAGLQASEQALKKDIEDNNNNNNNNNKNAKPPDPVDEALKNARMVRRMTIGVGILGRRLPFYKSITAETLKDPDHFLDEYERMVANRKLAVALTTPRDIHPKINSKGIVAKAAQALVKNGLLDGPAAKTLQKKLRDDPKTINTLMKVGASTVPRSNDRQKIRSLMLLTLAYGGPILNVRNWVLGSVDLYGYSLDLYDFKSAKGYHRLPNLPRRGGAPKDDRTFWKTAAAGGLLSRPESSTSGKRDQYLLQQHLHQFTEKNETPRQEKSPSDNEFYVENSKHEFDVVKIESDEGDRDQDNNSSLKPFVPSTLEDSVPIDDDDIKDDIKYGSVYYYDSVLKVQKDLTLKPPSLNPTAPDTSDSTTSYSSNFDRKLEDGHSPSLSRSMSYRLIEDDDFKF